MQNRYVGDVGDFGKYGLLRRLSCPEFTASPLSLGVFWYLVPDEGHNGDGKHISYLDNLKIRQCDPGLFDGLQRIVNIDKWRNVSAVEQAGLFPADTTFFSEPLTFEGMPSIGKGARAQRLRDRLDWVQRGLDATRNAALVFFDPDNGIEIPSKKKHAKTAPKYVYWDEITPFQQRGQSVLIYHHLGRTGGTHVEQLRSRLEDTKERLLYGKNVIGLRYHRGTSRAFIIVPADDHRDTVQNAVNDLLTSPWSDHFTLHTG